MRIVKEFPRTDCKITIFSWNGKYLIKIEQGDLEQTYKIEELDLVNEDELLNAINEQFIKDVLMNFSHMRQLAHQHLNF